MDDPDAAAIAYQRYLDQRDWRGPRATFEALRVRADPVAMDALVRLAGALRSAGYANEKLPDEPEATTSRFALGFPVPSESLAGVVGADGLKALVKTKAVERKGRNRSLVRSTFGILATGDVLTVALQWGGGDAYLAHDTFALLKAIWRHSPSGEVAIDLGTGSGLLAAALGQRYRKVVATDLVPSVTATAAITLALNPRPGHAYITCAADVTAGLRPGSANLVCANPPWAPSSWNAAGGGAVHADGGPTGFELPQRFIQEGSQLLAPGGVGLFQFCRPDRRDGGGYPIVLVRNELAAAGFKTDLRPSEVFDTMLPEGVRILEVRRPWNARP